MGAVGQVFPVQANVRDARSVAHAVKDAAVVVNAVGILTGTGPQSFDAVHVEGPRRMARAAREAGASRFIHVSAIGADSKGRAAYARSKAAGEAAVLEEFPGAVILRPSIVFGAEDQFFNRFAKMASTAPVLPLIGGGRTRFQPVFVGDLARAIANVANGTGKSGTIYEIGGPEVLTFRKLLDLTQEWSGRKCSYLPLPFWLASLQAILTMPLPNCLRPVTLDQVRMLKSDNVVGKAAIDDGRTLAALGVMEPHTAALEVPGYLEMYNPRGQFSHYRG
jgi:NADH dehydrogenase